jgi:hypothetical protein
MEVDMTESDLFARIQGKFPANAYAVFPQVRSATGAYAAGTADAVVMSLWPSRGLELMGFEIKSHRSDWLRELKKPEKAEHGIYHFCDRWWVVADKKVVELDEVPATWGYMVVSGRGLRIEKKAPKLEPEPVDKLFLAALLRNARDAFVSDPQIKQARKEGYKDAERRYKGREKTEAERAKRLEEMIEEFQEKSGIHISTWKAGEIGEAVRAVRNKNETVYETRRLLEKTTEALEKQKAALQGVLGELPKE